MKYINFKKYLFVFFSINISLIPFFLVTGPFLPDLSLSVCSLLYLFYVLSNKQFNVFRNFLFIFFLIFYFTIVLSSFLSDHIIFSLHSSLPYIRFGLFSLCVWHTAKEDKNLFNKIFIVLTIVYLALILDGYLQFFTGSNILNYEKVGVRVSSFFGDEYIMGSYVSRFFPIYIGLYFFITQKRSIFFFEKIIILLFFILILVLVIISGERTAFGLLIISFLFMLFFLYGLKQLKVSFLIIFIFISSIFLSVYQNNFQRLFIETKDQIFANENTLFFGERRHEYAKVSINIFKDNIFFGAGPRTYRIESKNEQYKVSELSWNTHPHNMFIQLLAETGLSGTILVFIAFCYFFVLLLRKFFIKSNYNKTSNFQICIIIAVIINIFPMIPSGNFFNNWTSIVSFYPISIFFALNRNLKFT